MQRQFRLSLIFSVGIASILLQSCGKSSGGKDTEAKPRKPTLTSPDIAKSPSDTPSFGEGDTPKKTLPAEDPKKPEPKPVVEAPKPVVAPSPVVVDTTRALKGLWSLAIAQNPRSCSSFYDLRDPEKVVVSLLCPSAKGNSIFLQNETFARSGDDGSKATWKRSSSTCTGSLSGSVIATYKLDAGRNLIVSEGRNASPWLTPVADENLAGDLLQGKTLHGRSLIRGCFRAGNLQAFIATGALQ